MESSMAKMKTKKFRVISSKSEHCSTFPVFPGETPQKKTFPSQWPCTLGFHVGYQPHCQGKMNLVWELTSSLFLGVAACQHSCDAYAGWLPSLLQGEDRQPRLQQGEPSQPLQDQGVLSSCLQKPQGAIWTGRPGVPQLFDQGSQGSLDLIL